MYPVWIRLCEGFVMVSLNLSKHYARFLSKCRHSSFCRRYIDRGRKREADKTLHFSSRGFQLHIAVRGKIASFGIWRRDMNPLMQHADRIPALITLN
jgi:hypothetical protein